MTSQEKEAAVSPYDLPAGTVFRWPSSRPLRPGAPPPAQYLILRDAFLWMVMVYVRISPRPLLGTTHRFHHNARVIVVDPAALGDPL